MISPFLGPRFVLPKDKRTRLARSTAPLRRRRGRMLSTQGNAASGHLSVYRAGVTRIPHALLRVGLRVPRVTCTAHALRPTGGVARSCACSACSLSLPRGSRSSDWTPRGCAKSVYPDQVVQLLLFNPAHPQSASLPAVNVKSSREFVEQFWNLRLIISRLLRPIQSLLFSLLQ